jgi:hypothetical protein
VPGGGFLAESGRLIAHLDDDGDRRGLDGPDARRRGAEHVERVVDASLALLAVDVHELARLAEDEQLARLGDDQELVAGDGRGRRRPAMPGDVPRVCGPRDDLHGEQAADVRRIAAAEVHDVGRRLHRCAPRASGCESGREAVPTTPGRDGGFDSSMDVWGRPVACRSCRVVRLLLGC